MTFLLCLAHFGAGAFLVNGIPHLVSGLQGGQFPTPFAKPRGVGNSTARTNVLWGGFNAVVGCLLLHASPFELGFNPRSGTFLVGALVMGVYLATHFGKVMRDRES